MYHYCYFLTTSSTKLKESCNIVNHKISTQRRKDRDLHDAYYHRSKYLLKKAKELEEITVCIVNLQITPTWEKGVQKSYHTEGHQIDFDRNRDLNTSRAFDTSTADITHETQKKQHKIKPKPKDSENICRICRIVWESKEDQESDSFWIGCVGKGCKCKKKSNHECNWWVHNRCGNIYYENTDAGERNLEGWAKTHFFCKSHMPASSKGVRDSDLQKDIVLQNTK